MADAPERVWIAEDEIGNPWWSTAPDEEMDEYTRTDLARAAVAEALEAGIAAGVRAGLEAAAVAADYTGAIQDQRDGSYAGSVAVTGRDVGDTIRAIAADPAQVAAIAAQVKGGE
jgi:hypothetical protein